MPPGERSLASATKDEDCVNAVLPVLAGLADSAVTYYLTREKK